MTNRMQREAEALFLTQGEKGTVQYPQIIASGGLGPCIAVGIYNPGNPEDPSSRRGHMLHEVSPIETMLLHPFIKETISNCGDISKLQLYVTGASAMLGSEPICESLDINLDDLNRKLRRNKQFVQKELLKIFNPEQVIFDWTLEGYSNELFLDTKTGEFYTDPRPDGYEETLF